MRVKAIMRYPLAFIALFFAFSGNAQFIQNNGISIVNSSSITTNGDWINTSGSNIRNNGIISTNSSFINNGELQDESTGGFVLNYATDTDFNPGGSSVRFLTKQGAGNLRLFHSISIKDSLLLKGGLLMVMNASDTVVAASTALLMSSASSYVVGKVARTGTGTVLFPIGTNTQYLPITLVRMQAQKATAHVIETPPGFSAGPGVESLVGFPYSWVINEKHPTDTAAYVEVNFASSLATVTEPIVVRQSSPLVFASMGAREIQTGTRTTVRSYSRRLKGTFSIAQGFPVDFETDSLALVALYNTTGGANWARKTGWLQGDVSSWQGVEVNGQSITALNLGNNTMIGAVPDQLVDIASLQSINLSQNNLTFIPDFSPNEEVSSLDISNNRLTFASIQPNASIPTFTYAPQKPFGNVDSDTVEVNTPFTLSVSGGGTGTVYKWKRNGTLVESLTDSLVQLEAVNRSNQGEYVAEITNPQFPGLTLTSALQRILGFASIGGTLQVSQQPANGKVTLLKVTDSRYDTLEVQNTVNGQFTFNKVILNDYQVLGFVDTLQYEGALPTYYGNTIFWEEAEVIALDQSITDANIISVFEPGASNGNGIITGTFEEEVQDTQGRTLAKLKVANAGVSARRVENTSRGKEEVLTLVAYTFTDENGEFTLPDLPVGLYRLNIQYPGIPMDPNSFITVPIGTGFQSEVVVAATVIEEKIDVKKVIITGFYESEDFSADVYPNPTSDYIKLKFKSVSSNRSLSLMDIQGRPFVHQTANEKESTLNVNSLQKGIYLLKIEENGRTKKVYKVTIE